jgi:methyl-accepting chemotaxis protein
LADQKEVKTYLYKEFRIKENVKSAPDDLEEFDLDYKDPQRTLSFEWIAKDNDITYSVVFSMNDDLSNQVNIINGTINSFENIIDVIKTVIPKVQAVNVAAIEINKEKEDILNKIESTSAIAEEISASSEEITASTDEMHNLSNEVAVTATTLNNMTKNLIDEQNKFII